VRSSSITAGTNRQKGDAGGWTGLEFAPADAQISWAAAHAGPLDAKETPTGFPLASKRKNPCCSKGEQNHASR